MNTLSAKNTLQIPESQIRTHLESVNRKLEAQNLQRLPINTSDWLVDDGMFQMYADSISSYIAELSDVIEAENSHRGKQEKNRGRISKSYSSLTRIKRKI